MSAIAFVKPNYPGERRVAILPEDIRSINLAYSNIIIESGFGLELGIEDQEYIEAGCSISSRSECYSNEYVFSLKLVHKDDYVHLKERGTIIGWMHPNGSGKEFYNSIAKEKKLTIIDIDSVYPRIYQPDGKTLDINGLPKHFFWENSYIAGIAATKLGLQHAKIDTLGCLNICILGAGSVSQGAFHELSAAGAKPRMFYRKTLQIFEEQIGQFDIIVNGIEVDVDNFHIIDQEMLKRTKPQVLIIDAAADAGRAIFGTEYQSLQDPIGYIEGRKYALVNNAPTLLHQEASKVISKVVSTIFLQNKLS